MDLVAVRCAKCDSTLTTIVNLWTQIGKKYITPVAYVEGKAEADKIAATGTVRVGDGGTLVEGCSQIIFRITSILLKPATDLRRKAEPKIQRILQLRGQPATTTQPKPSTPMNGRAAPPPPQKGETPPSRASFDIIQIQADLEAQQDEIQRIGTAGFQVMSAFDSTVARFEKQMRQLSDSVAIVRREGEGQQADIKSLKTQMSDAKWSSGDGDAVVARLDQQLQTTDRVVTELRQLIKKSQTETGSLRKELSAAQKEIVEVKRANARLKKDADEAKQVAQEGVATSKMYASEVASLRREMAQLRSELAQQQDMHRRHSSVDEDPSISSHQLDILASNISKIGNRASQVESLQMEVDLFRTRMQRLEARVAGGTPNPSRKDIRPSFAEYDGVSAAEGSQAHYGSTARKKRPPLTREDSHLVNSTPPKRLAISSDYPTLGTAGYVSTGEQQQSSPVTMALADTPVQRQMTAASSNKSTAKRGRRAKT
ncbi:hypothetical protein HDV57DRAFT_509907 [Trichoderma longibrachiatum]